ncbi:C-type lectin domain family 6 member A-like [Stegastes partitus]|uniref:C-type lectin domain family 6 member A-like n=1 Tax=Stegastes partitus TaxID=144197 RepID=A0A9Y4TXC6_9TELE|nr:PREDICTED: C-type lectin domain family 6 member A-like [Stegastes partitus]
MDRHSDGAHGERLKAGAAAMEPEEQIYVNLEELGVPVKAETKPGPEEEPGRWVPLKAAAVALLLLSLLLAATVAAVAALYSRDFSRLSTHLANHTAERLQLLVRYQNLSHERDQLQTSLSRVLKNVGSCPGGWKKFGCRCYFLSPTQSSWSTSRQQCSNQGAELVVIRSQEEMVFLNKLGDRLKFWIGLKQTFGSFNWEWTDGRSPATTFWRNRQSLYHGYRTQRCAAFNSFEEGNFRGTFLSWSRELCSQNLQWVCEKPAEYV